MVVKVNDVKTNNYLSGIASTICRTLRSCWSKFVLFHVGVIFDKKVPTTRLFENISDYLGPNCLPSEIYSTSGFIIFVVVTRKFHATHSASYWGYGEESSF